MLQVSKVVVSSYQQITTTKIMKNYKATCTEVTAKEFGKVISTTKIGTFKGMSKEDFQNAVKSSTCFTFEISEM
jgi:hypothetical protein